MIQLNTSLSKKDNSEKKLADAMCHTNSFTGELSLAKTELNAAEEALAEPGESLAIERSLGNQLEGKFASAIPNPQTNPKPQDTGHQGARSFVISTKSYTKTQMSSVLVVANLLMWQTFWATRKMTTSTKSSSLSEETKLVMIQKRSKKCCITWSKC